MTYSTSRLALLFLSLVAAVQGSFTYQDTYEYIAYPDGTSRVFYNPEIASGGKSWYWYFQTSNNAPTTITVKSHDYVYILATCDYNPDGSNVIMKPKDPAFTKWSQIHCTKIEFEQTTSTKFTTKYKCKNEASASKNVRLDHFKCQKENAVSKGLLL